MSAPLRFGIMCSGLQFPAWEAECIRALLDVADPVLLVIDAGAVRGEASKPAKRSVFAKLASLRQPEMAWTLYQRWFVNRRSSAMKRQDLSAALADVPQLKCYTIDRGKFSRYLSEDDVAAIREYRLDFIIRFAFGIVRGEVLKVPKYGVWSFHHDDIEKYRGGPPCYWEMVRQDPVTGATLQRINDRLDGGVVLRRGWFRTTATSYRLNRDQVYLGSSEWPAQVCRDIINQTAAYIDGPATKSTAAIDHRPGRWQLLRFAVGCFRNYVTAHLRKLFSADQWNVGVTTKSVQSCIAESQLGDVRWFPDPQQRATYIADPVPLSGEPNTILVEDFDYRLGVGKIQAYDLASRSSTDQPVPQLPSHLSYPFSFRWNGEVYCLPEASASRQLRAWKQSATGDWGPGAVLLQESILDPTLLEHDNKWWLFGTRSESHPDAKLWLWYAEQPLGPWTLHPQSPVKCDVRSARPAGPFVEANGKLYRPAQNCSRTYGGSITINRVVKLSTTEFHEEVVTELLPDPAGPWPEGLHTIAAVGNQTIIDGKRHVFIAAAAKHELGKRFARAASRLTPGKHNNVAGL